METLPITPHTIGSIKVSINGFGFEEVEGKNELYFSSKLLKKAEDTILQGLRNLYPVFLDTENAKLEKLEKIIKLRLHFDFSYSRSNSEKIEIEFKVENEIPLSIQVTKVEVKKVFRDAFIPVVAKNRNKKMYFYINNKLQGYKLLHACTLIPTKEEEKELIEYKKEQKEKKVETLN